MDPSIISSSPYSKNEIYNLQTIVANHNGFDTCNNNNCLQTLDSRVTRQIFHKNKENLKMFATGITKMDQSIAFNNGIPSNILCEIIGTANSGKTTLIYQIAILRVLTQIENNNGKINGKIIFIDCLNQFKIERFVQMCKKWIDHILVNKYNDINRNDNVNINFDNQNNNNNRMMNVDVDQVLKSILENIVIKNAMTFAQLYYIINQIEIDCRKKASIESNGSCGIDLILIDNFGLNILLKQLRPSFDDVYDVNKLGRKLKILARGYNFTIITTNTVNNEKSFKFDVNSYQTRNRNNENDNNGNNTSNNLTYWHACDWSLKTSWTNVFCDLVFHISVTNIGPGNVLNISTIKSNVSPRYSYALAHMTDRGIIDYDKNRQLLM